jgi:hypothetical protein
MGKEPDEVRREIAETRGELAQDVDALNEKVNPARIVGRRTERTRNAAVRLRKRVMGTASGASSAMRDRMSATGTQVGETTSTARDRVSETASDAAERTVQTAREMPTMVRERTEGNPLAAGVIAFGAGWLVSSLLPPTQAEKGAVAAALERAEPVRSEAREAAQDLREHMQEPAREAMTSVKDRTMEAKDTVRQETGSAASDVRDETRSAAKDVREETRNR